jgi:hypothetical protein
VRPSPDRRPVYEELESDLTEGAREFWRAHMEEVADGVIHHGKFESYFRLFRERILPLVHRRKTVLALLEERDEAARREFYDRTWNNLRWGTDGKGFRRLLHPNGICLTGLWEITEETPWSGYFRKGSRALLVGRYSTCCTETRRGHTRSLALVGKLFPTTDPNHPEPLRTANFITQEDFGGDHHDFINDAELRNAPNTRAWRRGAGVPTFLVTGAVLLRADKQPTFRQVYQIAELGKPAGEPTRAPQFMRFLVAADQPRIEGNALDFRDEIMAQIYDKGDPAPKRTLTFHIEATDEGETHGFPAYETRTIRNWRRIGTMTYERAVASYNGDFVIHFHHAPWRNDRNDPASVARKHES